MFFTPVVAFVLSVILGAAEAVQVNITMSIQAHDVLSLVIQLIVGVGVLPATRSAIAAKLPLSALTTITAVLGALQILQVSSLNVSDVVHTIIAVILVVGAGFGLTLARVTAAAGVAPQFTLIQRS
jgi:hypothetical protein